MSLLEPVLPANVDGCKTPGPSAPWADGIDNPVMTSSVSVVWLAGQRSLVRYTANVATLNHNQTLARLDAERRVTTGRLPAL